MVVPFPSNLSSVTQTAGIQAFQNAAAPTSPALRYRYPQKSIGKDDDYLEIGVIQYVPPGFGTDEDKRNLKTPTGSEKNSNTKSNGTSHQGVP